MKLTCILASLAIFTSATLAQEAAPSDETREQRMARVAAQLETMRMQQRDDTVSLIRETSRSRRRQESAEQLKPSYEAGVRYLAARDYARSARSFAEAVALAEGLDHGRGLYVQRDDEYLEHAKDELSELYALAAYRLGVVQALLDRIDGDHGAEQAFCRALRARADVIVPLAQREALEPKVHVVFERATQRCAADPRWRLFVEHDDGYWVLPDAASEAAAMTAYGEAIALANGTGAKAATDAKAAFCRALTARPDLIIPLGSTLSARPRVLFDNAKAKCRVPGSVNLRGQLHRRITTTPVTSN